MLDLNRLDNRRGVVIDSLAAALLILGLAGNGCPDDPRTERRRWR